MSKADALFAAALSLVVVGVALIYLPLALIVAGGLLGAVVWSLEGSQ